MEAPFFDFIISGISSKINSSYTLVDSRVRLPGYDETRYIPNAHRKQKILYGWFYDRELHKMHYSQTKYEHFVKFPIFTKLRKILYNSATKSEGSFT